MCPQNKNRGRVAHISNPATSGAQHAGEPSAYGGGQRGVQGAKPPGRGSGGCAPRTKRGGESPTSATPPRVGPNTLANPQPTRVGEGVQGGSAPLAGGVGGVPPQRQKRERVAHISNPATSGAQNAGKPSANGGGQRGAQEGEAPWQGVWGMCPQEH